MSLTVKTRKMLWGRSASRCSEPSCRIELVMDISETDDPTLVGEECHIVARKPDGPRGESPLTSEQRDFYSNLILMCGIHHKVIDDNESVYPVERLHKMKSDHEAWVRESLAGYDPVRQREDELYASYIQEWEERVELDNWDNWTSGLLSHGQPRISRKRMEDLDELRKWMFRRIWPNRHPHIEAAFENFWRVLNDLSGWMWDVSHEVGKRDKMLEVEKLYNRLDRWDPPEYHRLGDVFEFNVGVAEDLVLELTRAANLLCGAVRRELLHSYRLAEGLVVVTSGPYSDFSWKTFRPQYAAGTAPSGAYPGLDQFLLDREDRDISFGFGTSGEDYRKEIKKRAKRDPPQKTEGSM